MTPPVTAYDRDDFEPALLALLGLWRQGLFDVPDAAALRFIQDDMPAELKAFLLTVAYKGGSFYQAVPTRVPGDEWWLDSQYLEAFARADAVPAECFEHLPYDAALAIGSSGGGHVDLLAAWHAGDTRLSLASWDADSGEAEVIGTFTDLLKQALEVQHEEEARPLDAFARSWVDEARALGAALGEPPPTRDEPRRTVTVHLAAAAGDVDSCRALLDAGADVDAKSADGMTALMDAIVAGKPGWETVVDLLLGRGADPRIASESGETAGFYAINFRNSDQVLKRLLVGGLDPNHRGQKGRTLISWAGASGNLASVEALAAHGADLDARDDEGHVALTHTIEARKPAAVRRLLELGADGASIFDGWGPLFQAAYGGDTESAKLLLENGADPHQAGHQGKTAAQWARQRGHDAIVELFGEKR